MVCAMLPKTPLKVRTTISLTPAQLAWVHRRAIETESTYSAVIRKLITKGMSK